MTTLLGTLGVKLTAQTAQFTRGMKEATEQIGFTEQNLQRLTAAAGVAALAGGAMSLKLVEAASDAAEQMNVLSIAFGNNANAVVDWANETSKRIGRSATDLKDYAGQIGALVSPTLGVTKSTANMSKNLAQLAVDLGSVFNAVETDVLLALKSGLIGSTEPMQKFGVNMQVAALNAFAMEKGITQSVESMTAAQKVALRYAFIMEKTAAFQGDAERTARGWANMTKRVEGQLTDLAAELGAVLLPAAERLLEHISALVAAFAALSPETKRYLVIALAAGTAVAALAAATGALALALPAVASAAVPVAIAIGNLVGVFAIVAPLVDILRSNWLKSFAAILKDITNWAEGVEKRLESVRGLLDILAPGVVGIRGAKVVTAAMGDFADDMVRLGDEITDTVETVKDEFAKAAFGASGVAEAMQIDLGGEISKTIAQVKDLRDATKGQEEAAKEAEKRFKELTASALPLIPTFQEMDRAFAEATFGEAVGDPAQAFAKTTGRVMEITAEAEKSVSAGASAIQQLGDAMAAGAQVAGSAVLGAIGDMGQVIGAAVQGFAAGGPAGALAGVFADLATRTEAFGSVVETLNGVVGDAAKAVEPLVKALAPLVGVVATALSPLLRALGVAISGLSFVIGWVVNAMIDFAVAFLDVVAAMADIFGAGGEIRRFRRQIARSRVDLDDLGRGMEAAATGAWDAAVAMEQLAGVENESQAVIKLVEQMLAKVQSEGDSLAQTLGDAADANVDMATAAGGAADSFREATSALLGVPQGFKVAAARFQAIATDTAAGMGVGAAAPILTAAGARQFNIESVFVTTDDPEAFVAALEDQAAWASFASDAGTPVATAPDPSKR